jgi:hypothetical protein
MKEDLGDSVGNLGEGVRVIISSAEQARIRVEEECSRSGNSWFSCVRTVLGVIQGNAQLGVGTEVTEAYFERVEREVTQIGRELLQLEELDPISVAQASQEAIYSRILALKPTPEEIL